MISEIDKLEVLDYIEYGSLVKIDATHFIIAYTGPSNDTYIATYSIDGSSDNITVIDTLEHETGSGYYNSLIAIDSSHFMLVAALNTSSTNVGYLTAKTFSIDGSYNITEIDEFTLNNTEYSYYTNSLAMVDSTHFIVASTGASGHGHVSTLSIDGSYIISLEDNLEYETFRDRDGSSLVLLDSTHAVVSTGEYGGGDAVLTSFSIDGSYQITEIDNLIHDTDSGLKSGSSLVAINSTHLILSYPGSDRDGYIKTFSVNGSYEFTEIDALEHDTTLGDHSSMVMINSTTFLVAYVGPTSGDGTIKIISIDGSYDNITQIESLLHADDMRFLGDAYSEDGTFNSLIKIDDTHYALSYASNSYYGVIKTFSLASKNIDFINAVDIDNLVNINTKSISGLTSIDEVPFIN